MLHFGFLGSLRRVPEPAVPHTFHELRCYREAGCPRNDRVDHAEWADRRLAAIAPFLDLRWVEDPATVETAAQAAIVQLLSVTRTVLVSLADFLGRLRPFGWHGIGHCIWSWPGGQRRYVERNIYYVLNQRKRNQFLFSPTSIDCFSKSTFHLYPTML